MEQTAPAHGHATQRRALQDMLRTVKRRLMDASRAKKLALFYGLATEGERVLDVGVSSEFRPGGGARNAFLKGYRFAPDTYTGLAVQDMTGMAERYPGKRFVRYPGDVFPFADQSFDWVFSNAVVEHVGDAEAQQRFVRELMRVARRGVVFTTPAREFPIETHTTLPFLHWWPAAFFAWCRRFRPHYTPDSLRLLTRGEFEALAQASGASSVEIHTGRLLGLPMTYTAVCKR
jgi:hypothetical protein